MAAVVEKFNPGDNELVKKVRERYQDGFVNAMYEKLRGEAMPASSGALQVKERDHFFGRTETPEEVVGWLCKLVLYAPEEWYEIVSGQKKPGDVKNDFTSIGVAFDASSRLRRAAISFYHWKLTEQLQVHNKCPGGVYYIDRAGSTKDLVTHEQLPERVTGRYRVVAISDTHLFHSHLPQLPKGDILIHAGDLCYEESRSTNAKKFMDYKESGGALEGKKFLQWFRASGLPLHEALTWLGERPGFQHRVLVGGNHDFVLEQLGPANAVQLCKCYNVTYLHTKRPPQNLLLTNGPAKGASVKVWGSGVSFVAGKSETRSVLSGNNAFQISPDEGKEFVQGLRPMKLPGSVDIMVVHSPPQMVELLSKKAEVDHLSDLIQSVRPKLYVCGHAHRPSDPLKGISTELGGVDSTEGENKSQILGVNAACLGVWNQLHGYPIVVDMVADVPSKSICSYLNCFRA